MKTSLLVNDKKILCEKPIAVNLDQANLAYNALEQKKDSFYEAIAYRYHPQIESLLKIIKEGEIGENIGTNMIMSLKAGHNQTYTMTGNKGEIVPGCSHEIVGTNLKQDRNEREKENIAKSINAENGDIVLNAENGNIKLRDINIEDNRVDSNILDLYQGATITQDEKLTILYPYVITSTDTYDLSAIENTVCVTGLTGGDYSGEVPERTLPVCDEARFTYFNQPKPFTTEWEVESEGVVDFRLQYHSNIAALRSVPTTGTKYEYDFYIDWGDGSTC